jgi:hypothetical protein
LKHGYHLIYGPHLDVDQRGQASKRGNPNAKIEIEHRCQHCGICLYFMLSVVLSLIFLEKPLLDILDEPQLLGLFKIVVGRLPELLLCKRITRCSRPRVEVVRHFAKFGDRRHASISFRPTCFGATPKT